MTNHKEVIEILDKAVTLIETYPEHWNQDVWHCGTSHCLAGFCDLVVDKIAPNLISEYEYSEVDSYYSDFARDNRNLGYLFKADNTLDYIKVNIQHLKDTGTITSYDSTGYDEDDMDREGFNKSGYDSDGYDKNGLDQNGYDKKGYDENSLDQNGYSEEDLDQNGQDEDDYSERDY